MFWEKVRRPLAQIPMTIGRPQRIICKGSLNLDLFSSPFNLLIRRLISFMSVVSIPKFLSLLSGSALTCLRLSRILSIVSKYAFRSPNQKGLLTDFIMPFNPYSIASLKNPTRFSASRIWSSSSVDSACSPSARRVLIACIQDRLMRSMKLWISERSPECRAII